MSFSLRLLVATCVLSLFSYKAHSAHIVGGDLSYECLGGNTYEVSLHVYKNAFSGILLETEAFLFAIDRDNNTVIDSIMAPRVYLDTVPENNIGCVIGSPDVVTQDGYYVGIFPNLPLNGSGYDIVYQRCCRTNGAANMNTSGGRTSTYILTITREGLLACSDGPRFKKPPPILLCNNSPLIFDHSVIDNDGDDFIYSFCIPLDGQLTAACDFNIECDVLGLQVHPYPQLTWRPGYNLSFPMGITAPDPMIINSTTGLMSGTANTNGVFQLAICVEEYRNGVLLSSTTRDFQLSVASCQIVIAVTDPEYRSCNRTVNFNNNSINTDTWFWDFGDGNTSTDEEPEHTYATPGIYNVQLISALGTLCEDTVTSVVIVEEGPETNFDVGEVCQGSAYTFNNTTTDPGGNVSGYEWTIEGNTYNDFEPTVTFNNLGMIDVQLVAFTDSGCVDTMIQQMEVREPIVMNVDVGDIYCSNLNVQFTNNSTGDIESVLWDFGDGNTSTDFEPTHDYATQGNYTVTVTLFNSACGNQVYSETTEVQSAPPIDLGPPLDICSVGITQYTLDTTGFGGATITWSTGDTGPTANLTGGITTLTVTVDNSGCITTESVDVNSSDPIVLNIDVPDINCEGDVLVTTNNSTGDIDGIVWDFGDGNTSTDLAPTHTYSAPGLYTVTATLSNAVCGNELFSDVVDVRPIIPIDLGSPIDVCVGDSTSLTIDTTGFNGAAVSWSTGDTGPTAYFGGGITLTVTIDNMGCISSDNVSVTSSNPISVNIDVPDVNCEGDPMVITNNSTGDVSGILWDFGDGNTSTDFAPTHTYAAPGVYTVTAGLSNATCGNEMFSDVVDVRPIIPVDLGSPIDVCTGVLQSYTLDTTGFNGAIVSWSTGDTGPTAFFDGGMATLTVTVDNMGCISTDDVSIMSSDSIIVDIDIPDTYCSATVIAFDNNSSGTIESITWDFGDGNSSSDFAPTHTYTTGGTYTVTVDLINTVCGSQTYSEDIVIQDPIPVDLGAPRDICIGSIEVFSIDTTGFNGATVTWSTGETTPSINVTGGTLTNIGVTIDNGCASMDDVDINSVDSIGIDVIIDDDYCTGTNITLVNNSTGDIESVFWDFGDGGTSTDFSPTYTYVNGGQYTVSVDLINTVCGSKNYSKVVNVLAPVSLELGPDRDICVGSTEIFSIDTTGYGNATINWSTGETTPTISVIGGTLTDLSVTVDNGCPISDMLGINNFDSISMDIFLEDSYCSASSVDIVNNSTGDIESIMWDFGDGNTSTDFSPSHTYTSGGQFTVMADLINTVCGSKNFSQTIQLVAPLPVNLGQPRDICPGLLDSFLIDTTGYNGATITWSTGESGPQVYVVGGVVNLSVTVDNGCITSDMVELTSECEIFAPTAFVPGGVNSTFNVLDVNIEEYELRIYNRWGEQIFTTSSFDIGWDGTHNGVDAEMDVYVYIIDGIKIGGSPFIQSGVVALIR